MQPYPGPSGPSGRALRRSLFFMRKFASFERNSVWTYLYRKSVRFRGYGQGYLPFVLRRISPPRWHVNTITWASPATCGCFAFSRTVDALVVVCTTCSLHPLKKAPLSRHAPECLVYVLANLMSTCRQ